MQLEDFNLLSHGNLAVQDSRMIQGETGMTQYSHSVNKLLECLKIMIFNKSGQVKNASVYTYEQKEQKTNTLFG